MTQIEQLVQAIVRIAQRRELQDLQTAQDEINNALKTLTGLSAETSLSMSVPSILSILEIAGEIDWQRTGLLARLLSEQGRIYEQSGKQHLARKCFVKAFSLYDEMDQRSPSNQTQEDEQEMAWLIQKLSKSS